MDSLIPDAAVKAIQDSQVTQVIDVDGETFLSRPVYLPPAEPMVDTLVIHTLTGLLAYLTQNVDRWEDDDSPLYVHVKSPARVDVLAPPVSRHQSRPHPVCADAYPAKPKLNQFIALEEMIINLQTAFVRTDEVETLLRVLGNVTDEKVARHTDDGISQAVTIKKGLSLVEAVGVPNPIELHPFRTFVEVQQPGSLFVVRLREQGTNPPVVMLAEADGGAWQNEATKNIGEYLNEHLTGKAVVIY